MKSGFYVGLLSGTSMDGADAALIECAGDSSTLVHALTLNYPGSLNSRIRQAIGEHARLEIRIATELDVMLGEHFANAVDRLLSEAGTLAHDIIAIGSHGQTICHAAQNKPPFSLQLGDPNVIAEATGIDVIADFRRRDLAAGGQGAPLAPLLHAALLRSGDESRAVVNIGGIANITLLPANPGLPITGFDTGPGNCLLDENCSRHLHQQFDPDGQWAASGQVQPGALKSLLADPFFELPGPKSTGRETFNSRWVERQLKDNLVDPVDLQATLGQLTAETIATAIGTAQPDTERVLVCGGGVHNTDLMQRLGRCLSAIPVCPSNTAGVDPDWVEAHLFAWLARHHVEQIKIDTRSITGAKHQYIPGALYRG